MVFLMHKVVITINLEQIKRKTSKLFMITNNQSFCLLEGRVKIESRKRTNLFWTSCSKGKLAGLYLHYCELLDFNLSIFFQLHFVLYQ
jgi:hypothetical protein